MKHPEEGVYMTVKTLATRSGVSIAGVRKAIEERRLSGIKDTDGRWLIPIDQPLARTWLTGQTPDEIAGRLDAIEKRLERLENAA